MKLGQNFKQYQNVDVRRWDENCCEWQEFSPAGLGAFRIRVLEKGEEERVAQVWAQGFPELFNGTYGFVLNPNSYGVFFGDEWRMFVFESANGLIVGAWLLRMDQVNLSVDFTLVVVHPDFRGQGLLKSTSAILDRFVEGCGVELATISVARFHTATLHTFRGLGFQPVGILPGAIRASVSEQFYRRDSVELLYKLYGDAASLVPLVEKERR